MDINLVYMILGVIATMLVGIWGMKYTARNKSRTKLLFFENICISLFDTAVKDLEDLEIKYKGKTINENLILYRGTIFNSGNTDIDESIIHKPFQITLPENYEWKRIKIIDKSEDVKIKLETKPSHLLFSWDILKENEFFTFDSVIEYKPQLSAADETNPNITNITKHLSRNLAFRQRITNLKSVSKEFLPAQPKKSLKFILNNIHIPVIACFLLFISAVEFINPDYEVVHEVGFDSTYYYSPIKIQGNNKIDLIDSLGKSITKDINNILLTGKIKAIKEDINYFFIISSGIMGLFVLIVYISDVNSYFKEKKLYRRIKQLDGNY